MSHPPKTPERRRRVVHFDPVVFERLLDDCVRFEQERQRHGQPLRARGQVLPWLPADGAAQPQFLRQHLLAMLRAFIDAARPAGGLPSGADGLPQDLPALLAAGARASLAADNLPRVIRNIRAGQPVDGRLARAVLSFFKVFTERPQLNLDDIGGREVAQLLSPELLDMTVEKARALLTETAVQGLLAKAGEVGSHAWIWLNYESEYRDLHVIVDERGVPRMSMRRFIRYAPFKLVDFELQMRFAASYDWFEWSRYRDVRLRLRHFDAAGRCLDTWELALHRHLDERRGVILIEAIPEQAPEVLDMLAELARAPAGRHRLFQVEWEEQVVTNLADRDIIVALRPLASVRVSVDPDSMREVICTVGDSPGLVGGDGEWRLQRPLLPREMLAVRLRWRGLRPEDVERMSPSGELLLADLGQRMPPMRASFG